MVGGGPIAFTLLLICAPFAVTGAERPLTVADAINSTRAMTTPEGNAIVVSPDLRRYALMLIRGNTKRERIEVELFAGELDSLENAKPTSLITLVTSGLGGGVYRFGGSEQLTWPTMNAPLWLDNNRFAFFWEDSKGVRQAAAVDARSREFKLLTKHPTDVVRFSIGPKGSMIYSAVRGCSSPESAQSQGKGRVVTASDAWELLHGCNAWDRRNTELFVAHPNDAATRVNFVEGDIPNRHLPLVIAPVFSPDGRLAIDSNTIIGSIVPEEWKRYTYPHFRHMLDERAADPYGAYARQLQQLFLIDVERSVARPLWNAPANSKTWVRVAWSPDARAVLVGPTFMPVTAQSDTASLAAEAVAEIEVPSGRYRQLPIESELAARIAGLYWESRDRVRIVTADGSENRFIKREGRWIKARVDPGDRKASVPRVKVELRQELNTPPAIYGSDVAKAQEAMLLDLNPNLRSEIVLGRVNWLEHDTSYGRWEGRIYFPANYHPGDRYPVVVQTHTYAGNAEFSIYGKGGGQPALGPGISVYLAQPLASRGILVLHGALTGVVESTRLLERTQKEIGALEEVIESLVAQGIAQRDRVGIMGFSASGWLVGYALTHSNFPYAAAITDDNKDGSYSQALLSDWQFGLGEEMIGAEPFELGLHAWIAHSPAFNAHRVRAPLLLTVTSPGLELSAWEMFSRLRYLKKPVEYFLPPDLSHGSHGLQNPTQLLALQERAMDWWCFWLKGEEDSQLAKAEQYEQWRQLKEQRDEVLKHPRPPLLTWTATPVSESAEEPR